MSTMRNRNVQSYKKLLYQLLYNGAEEREEDWGESQGLEDYYEFFRVREEKASSKDYSASNSERL